MTDGTRPDRPTVLVHSVHVPQHKMSVGSAVLMGVGIGVGWIIPVGLVMLVTAWVWALIAGHNAPKPVWLYAPAILAGALSVAAWLALVDYRARVSHLKRTQARHDRLERIASRPDAGVRLPHRLIELVYRDYVRQPIQNPRAFARKLKDILSRAPRGVAVVVIRSQQGFMPPPVRTNVAFEPCELTDPNPQLLSILEMTWAEYWSREARDGPDGEPSRGQGGKGSVTWSVLRGAVLAIVGLGFIGGMLYQAVMYGDWESRVFAGLIVGALLTTRIVRLFGGRTWWVVPRGLIYRDHRLWRKDVHVRRITRASASLIIEMGGRGFILDRNKLLRCEWRTARSAGWGPFSVAAIIAAWVSHAPAPTTEQVLAFVGPDARLIE
jgi:hypothetical protein